MEISRLLAGICCDRCLIVNRSLPDKNVTFPNRVMRNSMSYQEGFATMRWVMHARHSSPRPSYEASVATLLYHTFWLPHRATCRVGRSHQSTYHSIGQLDQACCRIYRHKTTSAIPLACWIRPGHISSESSRCRSPRRNNTNSLVLGVWISRRDIEVNAVNSIGFDF